MKKSDCQLSQNWLGKITRRLSMAFLLTMSPLLFAYDLPTVNLGATSFLDGMTPAGKGWYFSQYLQNYDSEFFADSNGNKLPLPKTEAELDIALTQVLYMSDIEILGGKLAIDVVQPTILSETTDDGIGNLALSAKTGFGDLLVGPAIQWDPVMGTNGPKYVNNLELQFILPTGEYDSSKTINPSSNHWSFNPFWAGTAWLKPEMTFSWRLHYLYNGKNTNPSVSYGPGVNSVKPGQAVHGNLAALYRVNRAFAVGLNGYFLNQITDTEINGNKVSGRKEKVWAMGPGAVLSFSQHDHIFANLYFENDAENRSEGDRLNIRWVHHFH